MDDELLRAPKSVEELARSEQMTLYGQLAAGIIHEVKNAIAGIVGFTQIAKKKRDDPRKLGELLDLIEKEAFRCREILVNFLQLGREGESNVEVLEPSAALQEVVRLISHHLSINKVRLETHVPPGLPNFRGNLAELKQVLLNLVINAQQAMHGGGTVRLTVSAPKPDQIEIRVSDTGPGIPTEIAGRIFDPFFTTKQLGEGTGLGLYLSARMVERRGGKLYLENGGGPGATFVLVFPAAS